MNSCFIYALKTLDHVHYIGSAFNVRLRFKAHRSNGRQCVREAIRGGARVETLVECEPNEGYRIEREVIQLFKSRGQCELNDRLPGQQSDRAMSSKTALCAPVQTPDGGVVYKSKSEAARQLDVSQATIAAMLKRGELTPLRSESIRDPRKCP